MPAETKPQVDELTLLRELARAIADGEGTADVMARQTLEEIAALASARPAEGDRDAVIEELNAYRRSDLARLMSDISEDCCCAGWMSGNENALWAMAFEGASRRYGMKEVDLDDVLLLRSLAEKTGIWFVWDDADPDGRKAVSLDEFREAREALKAPSTIAASGAGE